MDIWDANKLITFIAFAIPGFVALKAYDALAPRPPRDASQQLIDAVAYSCVNYAVMLLPILWVERAELRTSHPTGYVLFWVSVVLISPVILACVTRWARTWRWVQRFLPHPMGKPWDYVFSKRESYWVIVTMKDGTRVAGRYDSSSFASGCPDPEQIYLQEAWVMNDDGGLERQRKNTKGIIILGSEMSTVELFEITRTGHARQEPGQPAKAGEGVPAETERTSANELSGHEPARRASAGDG
jgi:hypothetical protein